MILTAEGAEGAEEEKRGREERTFLWVGAGLFDLSATFKSVGEPAPTGFGALIECAVDRLYWNIWLSTLQGRERTKVLTTNKFMII